MDFADVSRLLYFLSLEFVHYDLTSTTMAVITSAVINLGIIAKSLNP